MERERERRIYIYIYIVFCVSRLRALRSCARRAFLEPQAVSETWGPNADKGHGGEHMGVEDVAPLQERLKAAIASGQRFEQTRST